MKIVVEIECDSYEAGNLTGWLITILGPKSKVTDRTEEFSAAREVCKEAMPYMERTGPCRLNGALELWRRVAKEVKDGTK